MTFLHAWGWALGIAAVSLPVVIHWLTRPRPRRLPLSTLRFVREVIHQRRTIHRLRNIAILSLRTLAVLLIAWAFARPLIGDRPLVASDQSETATRIIILDCSQSMAASPGRVQAFERARAIAAEHLDPRQGLKAGVILAAATAEPVFDQPSPNFTALREALSKSKPLPQQLNLEAAIARAAEMLALSPEGSVRRELVIVSDFQKTNWVAADLSPLPTDTVIQLESVAPDETPANLALLSVGTEGRAERGREVKIRAEVGNFSPSPREVKVEINAGEGVYRLEGMVPPNSVTTLSAEVLPHGEGWQTGRAKLVGVDDALPADNVRHFVLNVRPSPTYLLITQQSADRKPSSSYYIERALAPLAARPDHAGPKVVRIDPLDIDHETVAPADLIVLDHVGKLTPEQIELLTALMRRGRPLLYLTGETIDATNLQRITDSAGSALKVPVAFSPPPAGVMRDGLFFKDVERGRPPFNVFGDSFESAVRSLRFNGGLASRHTEGGLADDLLARYSDGSAALVITTCQAGSLAVLNMDLNRSNLPTSAAFVPLMGELVSHLLANGLAEATANCGESLTVHLPPQAGGSTGLELSGPSSADSPLGELVNESGGVVWQWTAAGPPGLYDIQRDDQVVFALATGIPRAESDLRELSPDVFKDRLAGGRRVHYRTERQQRQTRDDAWTWFALACIGCLLIELAVLKLFRT